MEQNLQEFNTNPNLLEWSERIRECRNSGMQVKEWCEANGISQTAYHAAVSLVGDRSENDIVHEQVSECLQEYVGRFFRTVTE